jgi:oxygen-independent coproporphyrinogen III oxidase
MSSARVATGQPAQFLSPYDRALPRYTSYPTAPHFTPAVDAARYRGWLAALDPDQPISLYLHVPFCRSLCLFCGCTTQVVRQDAPIAAYAALLLNEIDLVADAIGRRLPVAQIHWGGGTPSALGPVRLIQVMARLRDRFAVARDAEIALEIDPRHFSKADLAAVEAIGVTRASIGVQDFDPDVQVAIGRIQPFGMTERVVAELRSVGVGGINLDLIYGLPCQTEATIAATAAQALDLEPDRLAVFGYAHVPWMKRHQKLLPEVKLPDPAQRFVLREVAERVIRARGWVKLGLDHFARPGDALAEAAAAGRMRRNFQGYTTDTAGTLIGFGASAIGALPQGYVQNHPGAPEYRAAVSTGCLPVARGLALSEDDRVRRRLIETIMCRMALDLGPGEDFAEERRALAALAGDGLITWDGRRLAVTEAGQPYLRAVAAVFDTYLGTGPGRHSRAV